MDDMVERLMADPDWKQRWPNGQQRRQAIAAFLDGPAPAPAPAPLTLSSVQGLNKQRVEGQTSDVDPIAPPAHDGAGA